MKDKTFKINFILFTNADYRIAKRDCEKFVSVRKGKPKTATVTIAAYFNDRTDCYKVFILGSFGDFIKKEAYTWTDLQNIIHNNIF